MSIIQFGIYYLPSFNHLLSITKWRPVNTYLRSELMNPPPGGASQQTYGVRPVAGKNRRVLSPLLTSRVMISGSTIEHLRLPLMVRGSEDVTF
jgi:hypothetical protein